MELLEGIETRRSIRAFKSTVIPKEVIERVLQAASKSPSYTNTQPWEVAVVSGEKKDELSKILLGIVELDSAPDPDLPLPKAWPSELERRAREHGANRFRALGIERKNQQQREEMRRQNFRFYGAPSVLFLFMDSSLTSWSIYDMGLFTQNLILAAYSFGLGSCLQASIAGYPNAIREFLGLPKTKLLILGISIGYPDSEAAINTYQSSRMSLDDLVYWYT